MVSSGTPAPGTLTGLLIFLSSLVAVYKEDLTAVGIQWNYDKVLSNFFTRFWTLRNGVNWAST